MRTDNWYKGRLTDFFYENYPEFVNRSAWFINPAQNQFKGYLVDPRIIILLTCDDDGNITVEKTRLPMDAESLREAIIGLCHGMNAVSDEFVTYLFGYEGLQILVDSGVLEFCIEVNGLKSYKIKA